MLWYLSTYLIKVFKTLSLIKIFTYNFKKNFHELKTYWQTTKFSLSSKLTKTINTKQNTMHTSWHTTTKTNTVDSL